MLASVEAVRMGTGGISPPRYLRTLSEAAASLHGAVVDRPTSVICNFIRRIDQVEDIDELRSIFAETLAHFECKHFHYHLIRSRGEISPGVRLPYGISTYPPEWLDLYQTCRYLEDDPLITRALAQRDAFTWEEVLSADPLSPRQRQFLGDVRAANLGHSIAFPLHGKHGESAVLHVVPETELFRSEEEVCDRLSVLHLIAWHYHSRIYTPLIEHILTEGSRRRSLLSARERLVLNWTAKGKSTAEIAIVLKISAKTIDFHIENVKRKLQVYNRTHAVAKAIMLGLLGSL